MTEEYQHYSRVIPVSVCNEAIDLLFPNIPSKSEKRNELIKFITERFAILDCCVLYRFSKRFMELCRKLELEPGDQEVIISENFSVHYSSRFNVSPINY